VSDGRAARDTPLRVTLVTGRVLAAFALMCTAWAADAPGVQPRGLPHEVVLTEYSPLFANAEILRRLLSPLAAALLHAGLVRSGKALSLYPLDLAKERFLVYVPSTAPPSPRGYALLVFVPPWQAATLPQGWATQLDHYGVIFVTPAGAGNAAAVLSRRVPLALIAEANIVREFPVDPDRIYVGGFSGGSRVALRLALGYPDVFRGALLNAGADPLGAREYPLPPRDLFLRFQSSSHIVYVTGVLDTANLGTDASSSESMRKWCVADVETDDTPGVSHAVLSSGAFGRALARLVNPMGSPDPARLAACRSRVEAELQDKLAQVEVLISQAKQAAARRLLLEIDARYGGLAAPRSLELAHSCGCGLAAPQ
jgi:pimeloyl-ACP methyl ester carboxylesterase